MATSGSFNGSGGYQGRTLQFAWSRTSYSISSCYSDIYWELRVVGGTSSYYYHYHEHCYINGEEKYGNDSRTKRYTGTIASGTQRIYHNTSTGAGSFSARVYGAMYTSSYNVDTTQTFTLDTIPRQANITACSSSLTDEGNPYLTFSNPGSFNLECWLEVNPNGDHLATRTITTATSGTYTWTLTDAERKQLRQKLVNSNTGTIRIGLYSNNKTWASYKDIPFSIVNANPTLGTCSYRVMNNLEISNDSTIIRGYSNVTVTVPTATLLKEATIKSYKVIIGDEMKTSTESGTFEFTNVSVKTIYILVEDSRGNIVSQTLTASPYIEYNDLYLEKPTLKRDEGGIGTGVTMTIKGTMWTGSFGLLSNAITSATYYYKEQGASLWVQGATSISITTASNFTETLEIRGNLGANGFDNGKSYDIKLIVKDRLVTKEITTLLVSGKPLVAYHQNGVSFGAFYDKNEGGVLQVEGINIINLIHPIGSVITNSNADFDPNVYYPGTTWEKKSTRKVCFISGTKVITSSNNSVVVHTIEEVQSFFNNEYGITSIDKHYLGVSYWNGDGIAIGVHIEGATYQNGNLYAVFDRIVSGSVRVNYAYTYNKTEYYWQRTT